MGERLERLRGYLERDPDNEALRAEVFDAALAEGERAAARELLDRALGRDPANAAWRHRRAMLHLASGEPAQAQVELERLLEGGNDAPAIRHNLGYALFAQGHWQAASEAVAPLLALPGEGSAASLTLWLRCQHRLDRLDEGLEAFRRIQAQVPVAADAWGVASLMAIDAGSMDEARAWSDRALRSRPDQMEALAARGSLGLGAQDPAEAVQAFQQALRVNPGDGRSWSGLAFARMLALDLPGALDAFRRAVEAMPDHVGTWIGYGWCLILTRDARAAREVLERGLQVDRNVGEVHGALAVALARLGEAAQARAEIDVALRLDRTSLSARYAEAVLSGEADDPQAFLRLARRVLAHHPVGQRLQAAPQGVSGGPDAPRNGGGPPPGSAA